MKYFANILNPFAAILTKKLDEIGKLNLPIEIIAPSHGAIWRDDPLQIVKKYAQWANAYQEDQVTIVYDTMWEGTAKIAHEIADWLEFAKQLKFKNKTAAAFGCYGWSGESVKVLQEKLKEAGFRDIDENIKALWTMSDEDLGKIPALVSSLLS